MQNEILSAKKNIHWICGAFKAPLVILIASTSTDHLKRDF